MRSILLVALLFSAAFIAPSRALSPEDGSIVFGRYVGSGRASLAGITISYGPSRVLVTRRGSMRGFMTRQVTSASGLLEKTVVRLHGQVRSLEIAGSTFRAAAVIRLADGTVIQGNFFGLAGGDRRLARAFRGSIVDAGKSAFRLQAR